MTFLNKPFTRKQIITVVILLTLTVFQLVRVIVFVDEYGGLEHDGGWLLGVSRSLAEWGTFTTMVSTIVDPTVTGGRNIDGNVDVQDSEGRIWFYVANSVGPLVFGVNAVFLKIFGVNFWSLHAGSLFFFAGFLILAMIILLKVQGLAAALLFHAYLFFYPQLLIFLSYEALGEVPGMVGIFLAFIIFAHTAKLADTSSGDSSPHLRWYFLSGLAAGLALNTKLLGLLSLGGIFVLWVKLLWERRTTIRAGVVLGTGTLVIPALWELTHLAVLTRIADFDIYRLNLQGRIYHFLNEGSGIGAQDYGGSQFVWDKILTISEISHPQPLFALLTLLLVGIGGAALMWYYRRQGVRQQWVMLLWVGWLGNFIWFVGIGKTGWVRHAWFGLILAVMILCILWGESLFQLWRRPVKWPAATITAVVTIILLPGFIAQKNAATIFITEQLVEHWRQKQISAKYTRVPWTITPRAEQERVAELIRQLPPEANVYYPANLKVAEIAVQTGRIFYPAGRRESMTPSPHDVVIIGPTIISPWVDPGIRHSVIERIKTECPNFLYQSDYYIICRQW